MSEQIPEDMEEEAVPEEILAEEQEEEVHTVYSDEDVDAEPGSPKASEEYQMMGIDIPFIDEEGNEQMRRITVPILREVKERNFKIIKRKKLLLPEIKRSIQDAEEEIEEEYDACMLVETVTKTVLIRDVGENGDVEEREQEVVEEYFIGKERKYRYVTIEKTDDDGITHEVEELEVESEPEEEKPRKREIMRKRNLLKRYDSQDEFIGEEYVCEWLGEEEGIVEEEFSHIESGEEGKEVGSEEEQWEEEIVLEEEEWKALDELMAEEEEESVIEESVEEETEKEEIPKETSFERERKKQKVSFYKFLKLYSEEIRKRKELMKKLKLFCRLTGVQIRSPGKEFEENPQNLINYEASELEALTKHVIKVYDQYKEEEETHKKEIDEVRATTKEQLDNYKQLLLEAIQNCDQNILERLTKGKDLTKKVEDIFKYEELLAKESAKKTISTVNIEQIKYLLFTEIDQSDVPDEEKEVNPFELDKILKELKQFEIETVENRIKLEMELKNYMKILENVICKRRELDFFARKDEEFLKKKPLIEKKLKEREELYYKLKKYWRDWDKAFKKSIKDDYNTRFPAIHHYQKKMEAEGLSLMETVNTLRKHCPKVVPKVINVSIPQNCSETYKN